MKKALITGITGKDLTIRQLTETICRVVGFQGALKFDSSRPDGTARKLLDVSRLKKLGWKASTTLEEGLQKTYQWFLQHQDDYRN